MSLEEKAKEFATRAHEGQKRKYTEEPYIVHPARVAEIVRSCRPDPHMLAAAWLHDVVEDCNVTLEEIEKEFGKEVRDLVDDLTDISKPSDGNRAKRKQIDLEHTAKASPDSKTIKLADLIDNTESIVRYDPNFAKVYLKEKERLLYVLQEGNTALWFRAFNQL